MLVGARVPERVLEHVDQRDLDERLIDQHRREIFASPERCTRPRPSSRMRARRGLHQLLDLERLRRSGAPRRTGSGRAAAPSSPADPADRPRRARSRAARPPGRDRARLRDRAAPTRRRRSTRAACAGCASSRRGSRPVLARPAASSRAVELPGEPEPVERRGEPVHERRRTAIGPRQASVSALGTVKTLRRPSALEVGAALLEAEQLLQAVAGRGDDAPRILSGREAVRELEPGTGFALLRKSPGGAGG